MPKAERVVERCTWASSDPLLISYHDEEWGVPVHDDRQWYEKIVLDGAQAGLSWLTRIFSIVHCEPSSSTHQIHFFAIVSAPRQGMSGRPDGK